MLSSAARTDRRARTRHRCCPAGCRDWGVPDAEITQRRTGCGCRDRIGTQWRYRGREGAARRDTPGRAAESRRCWPTRARRVRTSTRSTAAPLSSRAFRSGADSWRLGGRSGRAGCSPTSDDSRGSLLARHGLTGRPRSRRGRRGVLTAAERTGPRACDTSVPTRFDRPHRALETACALRRARGRAWYAGGRASADPAESRWPQRLA